MPCAKQPRPVRNMDDVDRIINKMTLEEKVGQCMTLAFYGTVITSEVIGLIEDLHCGGLRLTPHNNTSDSDDLVRRLAPYYTPSQYAETLNEQSRLWKNNHVCTPTKLGCASVWRMSIASKNDSRRPLPRWTPSGSCSWMLVT